MPLKLTPSKTLPCAIQKDWRRLGKPDLKRTDMVAKCTGAEKYGIDVAIDGMVFAFVCANPGIGGDWFGRLSGMSIPGPNAAITTGS